MKKSMHQVEVSSTPDGDIEIRQPCDMHEDGGSSVVLSREQAPLVASWILDEAGLPARSEAISAGSEVFDEGAMRQACFALAKSCKWERGPVDVGTIEGLAGRFADIAQDFVEFVEGQSRDPDLVTRAIAYIEHHHGYPWGDRTDWFHTMLSTLVELACPNAASNEQSEAFYRDVEGGIRLEREALRSRSS